MGTAQVWRKHPAADELHVEMRTATSTLFWGPFLTHFPAPCTPPPSMHDSPHAPCDMRRGHAYWLLEMRCDTRYTGFRPARGAVLQTATFGPAARDSRAPSRAPRSTTPRATRAGLQARWGLLVALSAVPFLATCCCCFCVWTSPPPWFCVCPASVYGHSPPTHTHIHHHHTQNTNSAAHGCMARCAHRACRGSCIIQGGSFIAAGVTVEQCQEGCDGGTGGTATST